MLLILQFVHYVLLTLKTTDTCSFFTNVTINCPIDLLAFRSCALGFSLSLWNHARHNRSRTVDFLQVRLKCKRIASTRLVDSKHEARRSTCSDISSTDNDFIFKTKNAITGNLQMNYKTGLSHFFPFLYVILSVIFNVKFSQYL